jgi:hypothetical protein
MLQIKTKELLTNQFILEISDDLFIKTKAYNAFQNKQIFLDKIKDFTLRYKFMDNIIYLTAGKLPTMSAVTKNTKQNILSQDKSDIENGNYETQPEKTLRRSKRKVPKVDYTGMDTIEPESEFDGITDIWNDETIYEDPDYIPDTKNIITTTPTPISPENNISKPHSFCEPTYLESEEPLTLRQLLDFFQTAAKKDPQILDLRVFTIIPEDGITANVKEEPITQVSVEPEDQLIIISAF